MFCKRIISITACFLALAVAIHSDAAAPSSGLARVEGTVRDDRGQPIAGAKVFAESGLEGPLAVTQTDASGAFIMPDLLPGTTGVFAYAAGHAIDGRSANLTIDGVVQMDIVLRAPGTLSALVQDEAGKPIAGARVSRVLILGDSKVGIPLAKLDQYGITPPTTDASGRFSFALLPQGEDVALKVGHPQFAQEAPTLRVGQKDARVTLTKGVLVSGNVVARGRDVAVPNATLKFVNAQPPYDSVIVRSQADGSYATRLKPGPWMYQATGASFRSPNPQHIMISPDFPNQQLALQVAGIATLRGVVRDAKSGDPVANARLDLLSMGAPIARAITGPTGAYELTAIEGEAVVQLLPVPGYLLPPDPGMRILIEAGHAAEVPAFWVVPLPKYSLEVIDAAEQPIAGAIVRVLRPEQFGWRATDANGMVELSFGGLPADGTVVGLVEHPTKPEAALFAITRERSTDAIVQLLPLTSLVGKVVNEKSDGIAGVLVEARTILEGFNEPVALWRTYSGKDGAFRWPAAVPRAPLACFASTIPTNDTPSLSGESTSVVPAPDAVANIGAIVISGAESGRSALGRKYAWQKHAVVCGALPEDADKRPAIIVHVPAAQAEMMAEGLAQAQRELPPLNIVFAVVVPNAVTCPDAGVPVLRGDPPAGAYTYLVNANGEVVLECIGLPPVSAIAALAAEK